MNDFMDLYKYLKFYIFLGSLVYKKIWKCNINYYKISLLFFYIDCGVKKYCPLIALMMLPFYGEHASTTKKIGV